MEEATKTKVPASFPLVFGGRSWSKCRCRIVWCAACIERISKRIMSGQKRCFDTKKQGNTCAPLADSLVVHDSPPAPRTGAWWALRRLLCRAKQSFCAFSWLSRLLPWPRLFTLWRREQIHQNAFLITDPWAMDVARTSFSARCAMRKLGVRSTCGTFLPLVIKRAYLSNN